MACPVETIDHDRHRDIDVDAGRRRDRGSMVQWDLLVPPDKPLARCNLQGDADADCADGTNSVFTMTFTATRD
jgi:hypothetical protein